MALTVEQMDDLTTATLRNLQKRKMSQMATTMQTLEVMPRWFTKEKVTKMGGYGIEKRVLNALPGASRMITIDETDNPSIPRLLDKISVPWVHHETHYAWFIESDILMNTGESAIVDLMTARRDAALMETAEYLETKAWTAPTATDSPQKNPYGVPYWLPPDTSAGTGRFATTLPSGYTDIAGIVPSSTNGWNHYVVNYTNVTADDMVKGIRRAMDNTAWKSPVGKEDFYGMKGKTWRLYTGEETKLSLEDLARAQNQNIGADLAYYDNVFTIRGNAVIRTIPLDSATYTPLYGINHNTFGVCALKGAIFRESGQMTIPTNHRGRVVYTDTTFNFVCENRRHNFVVHKTS